MTLEKLTDTFIAVFGQPAGAVFTAPGRINLIGEHTDYNGSFVFPGAIDKGMTAAVRPNGTDRVRLWSVDYKEKADFSIKEQDGPNALWARYVFGVCREMIKRGAAPGGFDAAFTGDVPLGAGMSSSAALESVFAFALNRLFNLGFDNMELARIGQATEHHYVGVKCGIMDQFASLFGKRTTWYGWIRAAWNTTISRSIRKGTAWYCWIPSSSTNWLRLLTTDGANRAKMRPGPYVTTAIRTWNTCVMCPWRCCKRYAIRFLKKISKGLRMSLKKRSGSLPWDKLWNRTIMKR